MCTGATFARLSSGEPLCVEPGDESKMVSFL
jgi:hypothetical protein